MNNMKWCNFDKGFYCVSSDTPCTEISLVECLKIKVCAYARRVRDLELSKNKKHNEISLSWRNKAFYYQKKAIQLESELLLLRVSLTQESKNKSKENENV